MSKQRQSDGEIIDLNNTINKLKLQMQEYEKND